ncbi:uncharacterized protein LOC142564848 [Dermacentor variabilis]|uniref:uncharacterized protein LOC142564848 n=1 Tax=Dermacentor variabilis TaxID=34621 RepID=UPI003F5ADFFE
MSWLKLTLCFIVNMKTQENVVPALVAVISALVFALILPTVQPNGRVEVTEPLCNIVEFYNTSQPILTYYTTAGRQMCKDDIKINISDLDIYLLRGFRLGWRPPTLLHGNFCKLGGKSGTSTPYNAMKLTSTNDPTYPPRNATPWNSTETLLYATNDSVCGVFRVQLFSNAEENKLYEVRVRNAKGMDEIAEVCLNYSTETFKLKSFTNCTIYN